MAERSDVKPPNLSASPESKQGGWISQHKGIAIGGALVLAFGAYMLFFRKKSTASSTVNNTGGATATPTTVYPQSGTTGYTGARVYNALAGDIYANNQATSSQISTLKTEIEKLLTAHTAQTNPASKSTPTTNQGSGSTGTTQGTLTPSTLQTTTLSGKEYYVLGQPGSNLNVKTGAPVFATWTGQGTPVQGFTTKSALPGEVYYTPVSTPGFQIVGRTGKVY